MPRIVHKKQDYHYSDTYKDSIFFLWWKGGKPGVSRLLTLIPEDEEGNRASRQTLVNWVRDDFRERAIELDEEMYDEIKSVAVAEKVEMLQRHADIGTSIQEYALNYLDLHKEDLTVNTATRLLIEGVRIERESRGIPTALDRLAERSDEELLKELESVLSKSTIDIHPIEAENE